MITEVILPKLGQTMDEGVIVEWVKREGDPVKRGDLLFTVESDKAVLDVEATARGFLRKILVPSGQTVPVLKVVAIMTRKADEDISGYDDSGAQADKAGALEAAPQPVASESRPVQPGTGRIVASPRARKTAREKGVDLAPVTGTGPGGRIVEKDVLEYVASQPKVTPVAARVAEALGVDLGSVSGSGVSGRIMKEDIVAVAAPVPAPGAPPPEAAPAAESVPAVETEALTGLRRIIAERMAASHAETARVTLVTEADAVAFVEAREQLKATVTEEWGFAPGYNDLLALVVARALREFPYMNARLNADGTSIQRLPTVNLGMAVDTERGLLVPVIRDAGRKGLRAFGTEFRALVERARVAKSLPDDLTGGTFTITNLGMYDVDAFTPIINLPEAAILGAGRIQLKAVVQDGEVVARQMWTLSLVFDHRVVDGAPAARFLQRIKQLVENPFLLLG
jgi:pyruvate dehydrogenase E2 component (dihydrolipoamide acetyltransferase)